MPRQYCRWEVSAWLSFLTGLPTRESGKEGLHTGVGGVSVELGRGVPTHEVLGLEPDAFSSHRSPKGEDGLAVEPAALAGEFIELFRLADLDAAYLICAHMHLFFLFALKMGSSLGRRHGLKPGNASLPGLKLRSLRRATAPSLSKLVSSCVRVR